MFHLIDGSNEYPEVAAARESNTRVQQLHRVEHGYGFTHGASKTGDAGSGMVLGFGTPRHTATRTRNTVGIHGLNIYPR